MRNLSHFDLFAKFIVSLFDSFSLVTQNLQFSLFFFDVVLRVGNTKMIGVNTGFNFRYLVELVTHSVPYI